MFARSPRTGQGKVAGFPPGQDCIKVGLSASYHEERGGRVSEFMTQEVLVIEAEASLMDAAELFVNRPFRCYPVVNESRLVGQLSRRNILRALEKLW